MNSKQCNKCHKEKSLSEFEGNKNGELYQNCTPCRAKIAEKGRKKNERRKEKIASTLESITDENTQLCIKCLQPKSLKEFGKSKKGGAILKMCITCYETVEEQKTKRIEDIEEKLSSDEKCCTRCKKVKNVSEFGKAKTCNDCRDKTKVRNALQRQKKLEQASTQIIPPDHNLCSKCLLPKPCSEFKVYKNGKVNKQCNECTEKLMDYLEKNKCPHGYLNPSSCKECKGASICEHGILRTYCKECHGGSLCVHGMRKDRCEDCKDIYGRTAYCEHGVLRSFCRECDGGSFCEHGVRRTRCVMCSGGSVCEHYCQRAHCKYCDYIGYMCFTFCGKVRETLKTALKKISKGKIKITADIKEKDNEIEMLGCGILFYIKYLENKFENGMTWENWGKEWEIDHIIPMKYQDPKIEEVLKRFHYKNTQPLSSKLNHSKGNRFVSCNSPPQDEIEDEEELVIVPFYRYEDYS